MFSSWTFMAFRPKVKGIKLLYLESPLSWESSCYFNYIFTIPFTIVNCKTGTLQCITITWILIGITNIGCCKGFFFGFLYCICIFQIVFMYRSSFISSLESNIDNQILHLCSTKYLLSLYTILGKLV